MGIKLQGAVEYLMTYSWALLIIAVVIAVILYLGLFNPSAFVGSECVVPADFNCIHAFLYPNGIVYLNLGQATPSSIQITTIGCSSTKNYSHMNIVSPPITLQIGNNATFNMQCYVNNVPFNGPVGTLYTGYIVMNYTDLQSGFPKTLVANLVQKVV